MRRSVVSSTVAAGVLVLAGVVSSAAPAVADHRPSPRPPRHPAMATVSVTGAVTTPQSYSLGQLAALPQTTLPDTRAPGRTGTVIGVLLADLVTASAPTLPAGKNTQLTVALSVSGERGRSLSIADGELDPGSGNHPGLLALTENGHAVHGGPELVFPGDHGFARTVAGVDNIDVAVTQATVPTPPAGSVVVLADGRSRVLTAATLAALPARTLSVSFLAGTVSQTHAETGPTLASVLRAARVRTGPSTVVGALGDDGYLADVTPAESTSGGRPLLLSTDEDGVALAGPRLIADGDVKGGRDVSGVVELVVVSAGGRCGRGRG